MPTQRVNYDQIAPHYHQRYANELTGIARELRALAQAGGGGECLEVGCGTGRWFPELQVNARHVYGLDFSLGMLQQARARDERFQLTCGDANDLPFRPATFNCIVSVNALQHFADPRAFIVEARRVLRPDGALALINLDPHTGHDHWYLYEYFEGTRETDLRRFQTSGVLLDWLIAAGFKRAEWRVAERIHTQITGRAILDDYFLQKYSSSQLALLTDEMYAAGLNRIQAALADAEANGTEAKFITDLWDIMLVGWLAA